MVKNQKAVVKKCGASVIAVLMTTPVVCTSVISFKRWRRMGGKYSMYSEAVPDLGDVGYVAVIIYDNYRLGLIHCPRHVKDTIQATVV